MEQNNNNNKLKNLAVILIGLVVFWLIFNEISIGNRGYMYGGHMGVFYNSGPGLGGLLISLIALVMSIVKFALVISLVVGIFQVIVDFIKNNNELNINTILSNKWLKLAVNSLIALIILSLVLSILTSLGGFNFLGGSNFMYNMH